MTHSGQATGRAKAGLFGSDGGREESCQRTAVLEPNRLGEAVMAGGSSGMGPSGSNTGEESTREHTKGSSGSEG